MKILLIALLLIGCSTAPTIAPVQTERQQPDDTKTQKTIHDFFNSHD